MALLQAHFFSKSVMRTIPFQAIVPLDQSAHLGAPLRESKPFKTLYLLHGIFGSHNDWISGTRIQSLAEERNLVVILPSGENRFYLDNEISGERHGELIGRELVEFTRALLPLSKDREDTFLAGLSMGGYGAIRNGLKYHDTFGYIAGLSAALIVDTVLHSTNDSQAPTMRRDFFESVFGDLDKLPGSDKDPKGLIKMLKQSNKSIPGIYLCCGTEDFLIEQNRDYHRFLSEQGVHHTYVEGPGVHNWAFWDAYIRKVLDWLPLEKAAPGEGGSNAK